jgi:hypothetical protein
MKVSDVTDLLNNELALEMTSQAGMLQWALPVRVGGRVRQGNQPNSPVLTAIQGWVLVFEDPDAGRLRLYTLATHGPETKPDASSPWLQ